jgi:MFS family permease
MGLSSSFEMVLAGRFLIGFGSAFAFVGVLKLATIWLPPDRFAFIAGLTTTLGMVGAMFGQNVLKSLVLLIGWQQTIIYFGLLGFLLVPIIWFVVRDTPNEGGLAIEPGKLTYRQLGCDILKLFGNAQIWINGIIGGLIILPTTIFAELWGVPFLKLNYGLTEQSAVLATSMIFLGWAVGSPLMGGLSDYIKRRRSPLIWGALAGMAVFSVILYSTNLPSWMVFSLLFLFGVISSVEVIVFAVARESAPESIAGTAVAMTNFLVVCAGPFQWIVGKLLDSVWDGKIIDGQPFYTVDNYHTALLLCPLSMGLAFILGFALKETYCQIKQY